MRPGVLSMIPKQKGKAWNDTHQALQKTIHFYFKSQKNKVAMVIFFNRQGIIHKEFVPPYQMVNKEYYVEVMSCLFHRIH
jgi:Tfp pilus assembly ATPase PilU